MSNHARTISKLKGLKKALIKLGYDEDKVYGTCSFNTIMIKFLKENKLPYQKWNNNYKGTFTADLVNAKYISENCFNEFVEWAINKLSETHNG